MGSAARKHRSAIPRQRARFESAGPSRFARTDVGGEEGLWTQYRAEMLNSLRALSEPTGGFAVLENADFAEAMQRIDRAMR